MRFFLGFCSVCWSVVVVSVVSVVVFVVFASAVVFVVVAVVDMPVLGLGRGRFLDATDMGTSDAIEALVEAVTVGFSPARSSEPRGAVISSSSLDLSLALSLSLSLSTCANFGGGRKLASDPDDGASAGLLPSSSSSTPPRRATVKIFFFRGGCVVVVVAFADRAFPGTAVEPSSLWSSSLWYWASAFMRGDGSGSGSGERIKSENCDI